jgi:DNA-directed RNA polymerase subunit E'/Rpb7
MEILTTRINETFVGKCIEEGFIKPNSINILSYSPGIVHGDNIEFVVVFQCMICLPVERQRIKCTIKSITKAGIHAEVKEKDITPLHIFVAKEHHTKDNYFKELESNKDIENLEIVVQVIGIRFEINDPYICVIAKLIKKDDENKKDDDNRKKIEIHEE